jgi:hypothetical protein
MSALFYMPLPGDPAKTSVNDGRLQFTAYVVTEFPNDPVSLILFERMRVNPWFGEFLDTNRQQAWLNQ